MTEEDKRQQKAMLLLEHQEAEEHLAHLREKARRVNGMISEVNRWASQQYSGSSSSDPPDFRIKVNRQDHDIRTNAASYREAMDLDALIQVIDEIKAAEAKVAQLASRKAALGLK